MKRKWLIPLIAAGACVGIAAIALPGRYAAWKQAYSLDTTHITYIRRGCISICPTYQVDIYGDGRVVYQGHDHVAVDGAWTYHVPRKTLQAWLNDFRVSGFWSRPRSTEATTSDSGCRIIMQTDRRTASNGCYYVVGDDGMSLETPSLAPDITQMEAVIHLDSLVSGRRQANIVPPPDEMRGLRPYKIRKGA